MEGEGGSKEEREGKGEEVKEGRREIYHRVSTDNIITIAIKLNARYFENLNNINFSPCTVQ